MTDWRSYMTNGVYWQANNIYFENGDTVANIMEVILEETWGIRYETINSKDKA